MLRIVSLATCDNTELRDGQAALKGSFVGVGGGVLGMREFWGWEYTMLTCTYSAVWSKLWRREAFDGVRFLEGCVNEDREVEVRLMGGFPGVGVVDEPMYAYRKRAGSITDGGAPSDHLDGAETLLARDPYFAGLGWGELREGNLCSLTGYMARAEEGIGREPAEVRERYARCRARTRALCRELLLAGLPSPRLLSRVLPCLASELLYRRLRLAALRRAQAG